MTKKLLIPLIFLILGSVLLIGGFFWWRESTKPVSSDNTAVRFVVPKGRSAIQIAEMLYEKKLIRSPLAFKIYVQVKSLSRSIQAGEFQLSAAMPLPEIIQTFLKGPLELWVTVPEGLRKEEVVERFIEGLKMDSFRATAFREEFLDLSVDKEGYLFPDTYLLPRDISASKLMGFLTQTWEKKLNETIGDQKISNGLSLEQTVVLASLIERETKRDDERPVVAGILLNRIEIGMGLQVDATVQYAVASAKCLPAQSGKAQSAKCENWWPTVTRDDLEIDSPYNTYKYKGLPPTAIANPGLSSLRAAIFPQNSDYFYYLHDADGVIHYAENLEEHNGNVRKYLRK